MSEISLKLDETIDVTGGAIRFSDAIAHPDQEVVARFHVFHARGDGAHREVELRVGDKARAGSVAFELLDIQPERTGATIFITELTTEPAIRAIEFETPFEMTLGDCARLPSGQVLTLTGIAHYGIELLFTDSDECANFTSFDFGFWRTDGVLFEIDATDIATASVTLRISADALVTRTSEADFGSPFWLGPKDAVRLPDGAELRLRRAIRASYDAVDWHLYATKGDDIAYPYESVTTGGEPASVYDRSFRLLGHRYQTLPLGQRLAPHGAILLRIEADTLATFPHGEQFHLETSVPRQGPDGLVLTYRGLAHAHGTRMGEDGELIPVTDAWADFGVVKDEITSGFTVDLVDFANPYVGDLFGCRFTVSELGDSVARVRVDPVD